MTTIQPIEPKQPRHVHQCECGSQLFHLCDDGDVLCYGCKITIQGLKVLDQDAIEELDVHEGSGNASLDS